MLIDWFTVVAQLLNFLVLIWLMKRFLYQPILNALDAREQKINAELNDALTKKQQAEREYENYCSKNQEIEQQRAELFKAATEEVKLERQRLLQEAQQHAESLRAQHQQALQSEQQNLLTLISQQTQAEILAIARQTLADLAGVNLEQQMISVFIAKLQQQADDKQSWLASFNDSATPLLRTTFELSPSQMAEIEQAIANIFALQTALQFKTAPHLIAGIELSCGGQKISWSIADYLGRLEKNLHEVLQSPH